jgi:hypothetical protein
VEGEQAVHLRFLLTVERAAVQRTVHRSPERVAVVAHRVHDAGLSPENGAFVRVALELCRAAEQGDRLLELVATQGELSRPSEPPHGAGPEACQLVGLVVPGEVRILHGHRLREVVCQQGRQLVRAPSPSSHSASDACSRSRRAFGIVPYATSRVRACLMTHSWSPPSDDPGRRRTKSRSSSGASSGSLPSSSRMSGRRQKVRPTTDAA